MPRPSLILALGLEKDALAVRNGKTGAQAIAHLNKLLKKRGVERTISRDVLERYWASLDKESLAPAHRPQVAASNANIGMNLSEDIQDLHDKLSRWLAEAEDAKNYVHDSEGTLIGEEIDWRARTSVAKEFRETLKFVAEMLERIYNVEQIKVFQQTVLETVGEADPKTQQEIKRRFQANQQIVRAQLLGLK